VAKRPRKPTTVETVVVVDARQTIAPTRENYDQRVARVSVDTALFGDYAIDRVHEVASFCSQSMYGSPLSDAFMRCMKAIDALRDVRFGADVLVRKEVA
jgi:hypothetical protein